MSVTTTKPRRLLCRAWEVRAYLSGAKTQFRVPIKPQPVFVPYPESIVEPGKDTGFLAWQKRKSPREFYTSNDGGLEQGRQFGTVGQRLWLAETWATDINFSYNSPKRIAASCVAAGYGVTDKNPACPLWYQSDNTYRRWGDYDACRGRWRSAATMPQWASRLSLEVKSVRVQRLQDINESDAIAEGVAMLATLKKSGFKVGAFFGVEGVTDTDWLDPRDAYEQLWESIHGPGSWESNPWVFAVEVVSA